MFSYSILARALNVKSLPNMRSEQRYAAVALLIDVDMNILMIQRPRKESDPWSGHMAFPGGRFEQKDSDLKATAERECSEEVGVFLADCSQFLGALSVLQHPRLSVAAFVYYLPRRPRLICNEEVADYFWLSLQQLAVTQRGVVRHTFQEAERSFPAIHLVEVPIWGISLNFLDQIFKRVGV